jgi:hypothetical protein
MSRGSELGLFALTGPLTVLLTGSELKWTVALGDLYSALESAGGQIQAIFLLAQFFGLHKRHQVSMLYTVSPELVTGSHLAMREGLITFLLSLPT